MMPVLYVLPMLSTVMECQIGIELSPNVLVK